MNALTAENLYGVWAAVPTPWNSTYRLDAAALEENIWRYKAHGVSGVYTTDSDGEFYALELNQFRELASIFGRAVSAAAMPAAMGVTWCHTEGILDRIRAALDVGVPNVHIAFPFWMPLAAVPAALAGTRGVYSYWVNTLPDWTLETWELCRRGAWQEAMHRQARLIRWETEHIQRLRRMGYNHGVIGKARAKLVEMIERRVKDESIT
jgi:dihydrodipicolinate synthase/N-acetylneuraminate lyase